MSITATLFLLFYGVSVLLTFYHPAYGTASLILIYFINPNGQWWFAQIPDLRYVFFLNLALIGSFILFRKKMHSNAFFDVPHLKCLASLIVVVVMSSFVAVDPITNKLFIERLVKMLIFVFIFFKVVDSQKKLDLAIYSYCIGAFFIGYQSWLIGRKYGIRLEAVRLSDGTDANGVAVAVLISIPFLLFYLFASEKKIVKCLSLIALIFNTNALILFNSRGAFLGLILFVFYSFIRIVSDLKDFKIVLKSVVVLMCCAILLMYVADTSFWSRMSTITKSAENENHVSRVSFWKKTFEIIDDYPLGAGAGGFEYLSPSYMPAEWLTNGKRAVHSTWFEILSSFGYQGLVAYLLYVFFCFKETKLVRIKYKIVDKYKYYQAISLEAALVACYVPATFLGLFFVEYSYWVPMFIAVFYKLNIVEDRYLTLKGNDCE